MGDYISNKIRCKNCVYFNKISKSVGVCKHPANGYLTIFVRPNQQADLCFVERGDK